MPLPVAPAPVSRPLLREGVLARLREVIVDGTLAPGEQVRDGEVAAWLGVSRTPVREALLKLADAGLVATRPGRSTTVTALDSRAERQARDVVAAMHRLAVTEAVTRLHPADLEAMREANRRFADAVADGDLETALHADADLHEVPVRVAGNDAVASVLAQFTPVLRRAERLRFADLDDAHLSVARHAALIELCASGDPAGAGEVAHDTWRSLATDDTSGPLLTSPDQPDRSIHDQPHDQEKT